ncbi:MAG: sulfatase-like hydrolase/transferase [Cytophagales bacterium]|nr:sulfatase-like hydrolase/transferase [Cytophagales bacterium]
MEKPNIIFIVADDLGYADLGCYGGRGFDGDCQKSVSPELDKLASNGMLFTEGYANSPVCSPTRFALMTARYQYRLRGAAEEPISSKSRGSTTLGLPPAHPTLPSLLRAAGYATALIGKWHLGFEPSFGPLQSGYDEFFGPMSGGVDYFTHCDSRGVHDLWQSEKGIVKEQREVGYLTDLITERALNYIERTETRFFMSLHYTAPHWPWETRDDLALAQEIKDNIFHLHGGNIHSYRRMIHHMDEGIGRIASLLQSQGRLNDTLIVFTSDNGGERFSDNWPLVGGKMDLTEGGIRVPYIAHWPRVIQAGQVSAQQCLTMDWSATMLEAGAANISDDYPLDGQSLLKLLVDPAQNFERPLFWRMNHRGQRAMRLGAYKYLRVDEHDYLFDLTQDARERANLGHQQPDRLLAMRNAWEEWNATMPLIPADATVSLGYGRADMPQR